jgi:hypothetical protein
VAVAALVVLVAGAVGTYIWALGHWFVGVDGEGDAQQVAVFRGLDVSVVGFDFYELDEDTDLALTDLRPHARSRVQDGITADDSQDADRILDALREERLPVCPTAGPAGAATSTATPSAPVPAVPSGTAAPATTGVPATSSRTTTSSEPGVDCREGD